MIQVLGKDTDAFKKVTCYHCASILQYTPSEVQVEKSTDYTGYSDYYKYIKCPSCNHAVYIRKY